MQRISLEIYTTAYEATKILENVADQKVEVEIPAGSVLLDNILNLKLILESAKKMGKTVDFSTPDPFGQNLIKQLNGEKEEPSPRVTEIPMAVVPTVVSGRGKVKLPSIRLPNFKVNLNVKKLGLIIPVLILLGLGLGFLYLSRAHKAKVVLHFTPQNLTKSVTVKVGDGMKTDLDKKVLAGLKVTRTLDHSAEIAATGTKLEGDKAEGSTVFYNYTSDDIVLKKGTKVTYEDKDNVYNYLTAVEITIPKSKASEPNPEITITPGSAQVDVTAENIGSSYNIKKDKELDINGYDSKDLMVKSAVAFSGGSSKEISIVTQADLTKLEQELGAYVDQTSPDALKNAIATGYSFVDKSQKVTGKSVIQNNKAGDEKTILSGSITAQVEGLTYSKTELADFMGKLSENLVPPGFEFYSYNKDVSVEVLGNTENTVLSPTEADLQVTFRFFIVPKIDKTKVFESISGNSSGEAAGILKAMNGIDNAELTINPGVLFFKNVPTRESAVEIETKIGD